MASTAVATWTACVTGLQKFVANTITAPQRSRLTLHVSQISNLQSPLPHAAMEKLVHEGQVMRKLADLCMQTHQQNAPLSITNVVWGVLGLWLYDARAACAASPQSRLAASARQQLRESGLMEHLAAILTNAAEMLTAAAAPAVTEQETASGSSSRGAQEAAQEYLLALVLVQEVLQVYHMSCWVMSDSQETISLQSALPAAPAAVRLILTTFHTCSRVQQLAGSEGRPAPAVLLATDAECQQHCAASLGTVHHVLLILAEAVDGHLASNSLLSLPGARELLLCPELVPCFALNVLVAVLVLDTGGQGAASSSSATPNAVGTAATRSSSSSNSNRTGSRRGPGQASSSQGSSVSSGSASTRRDPTTSTSSSGRLGNGISLDSLTPLSCGLFGLLGVDQRVLLEAARAGDAFKPVAAAGSAPDYVDCLLGVYTYLLSYQVEQLTIPCGLPHAQLLLHAETDMLLTLAVHQLTASIPASYPGAQDARKTVCDLRCYLLCCLCSESSLHMLPLPAAYTGPQLALQVMPCALEQQLQQQQCYTVTPTAQLLTELLPLLISYCLARVQQQHQQRQGLLQACGQGQTPAQLLSS